MAEVGSLIKGVEILRQLSPEPDGLTAAEIGERLDIPRTTAIRFLNTLCRHNYAVKAGAAYYLGPAALAISMRYLRKADIVKAAEETCRAAAQVLKLPVSFFIEGNDVVTMLARVNETVGGPYDLSVGAQLNLAHSAAGIAVLMERYADLTAEEIGRRFALPELVGKIAQARTRGYAISHGEVTPGYAAIAVSVRSETRSVLGAFHVVYREGVVTDTCDVSEEQIVAELNRVKGMFLG